MQKLLCLLVLISILSCSNQELNTKIDGLERDLAEIKIQLADATTKANYTPGLIHSVFFWLKSDLSESEKADFLNSLNSLKAIDAVRGCYIGPPAPTVARGVVDNSFSYALLVHFDDVEGHDAYQTDPLHLKFVADQKYKWSKVIVHDNVMAK